MLLEYIRSYLKLVLRYKFLILDTYHQDIQYLRKHGYEDPWLFFEAKGVCEQKSWGKTALEEIMNCTKHPTS